MTLVGAVLNVTKEQAPEAVRLIEFACCEAGMETPLVMASTAEDPGHVMTRRALDAGCDVVLAVGGDGTVRAVAAELTGTSTPMGVVPMGTGNLFARNIGLPHDDLLICVHEAIHGTPHWVDTLQLELRRPDGPIDEEISLVIAGGGLDAEVMADTREVLKARAGWLAYGESGLRHAAGDRKNVRVELEGGETAQMRVRSVLLANCGTLQGGVQLIPTALFDDGQMDIVLLSPRNPLDWARIVAKTVLRWGEDIPVMTVKQSPSCTVEMDEPLMFQIDGDAVGDVIGVKARVSPSSLKVNGVSRAVTDA